MSSDVVPAPGMALPVACSLNEQELEARVGDWGKLVDRALVDREPTHRGIRLTFSSIPGIADEVARLIELEATCCAWMSFTVEHDAELVVDVSAADEIGRRAVREMFGVSS